MDELKSLPFAVKSVKRADKQRSPAPPFTTSTLQQEASRKLNMTPRRTMAIAQQLYEGVDITGEGTVGLITYMYRLPPHLCGGPDPGQGCHLLPLRPELLPRIPPCL